MAKNKLFVIILCSIHGFWAEGSRPFKLTASRSAIIETDSVTLTCEGQRGSRCFLYIGRTNWDFSCNQAFTGTELLQMAKLSAPANVEVKCCIFTWIMDHGSCSDYSDRTYIDIQSLPAPEMTVNPTVITEMDTVTLTCVAPSSVSVSTCYLYILAESSGLLRSSSCHQKLRGTELLQMINMTNRRLPAELKVNCRYTAEPGQVLSQYGKLSSILIQDEPEEKADLTTFIPSKTSAGPTSRTSSGPTSRTSSGPTSRTSTGPTSRTSTGPTSRTSTGPTSRADLWILKVSFVALTGFGSVLGITLLFSIFVICQRADDQKDTREPGKVVPSWSLEPYMIANIADSSCDDLNVQIMQETKNDDPVSLYHTYSTIPD